MMFEHSPKLNQKMGDELATLMDLFHSIKKTGRSATLTLSTKGGKATIVKLEFELNDAKPSSSSTSSASSPSLPGCQAASAAAAGDRHRHRRSAARRAKANARAAQHRAFQALPFPGGDYSAALGPPDPSPPQRSLHLHPSPKEENRRLILTVDRKAGFQPTFSQLDGDGDPASHSPTSEPSSSPSPTTSPTTPTVTLSQSSPPVTPPRSSRPYNHPPPLSPTADSELVWIPSKSANFCCHCRTECPCIFGRPCRGCPARLGGRPHFCNRCPGSWCHTDPPYFN